MYKQGLAFENALIKELSYKLYYVSVMIDSSDNTYINYLNTIIKDKVYYVDNNSKTNASFTFKYDGEHFINYIKDKVENENIVFISEEKAIKLSQMNVKLRDAVIKNIINTEKHISSKQFIKLMQDKFEWYEKSI